MKVNKDVYDEQKINEFLDKGVWAKEGHCDKWDWCAQEFPEKEAIVDSKTRMTWSQAKLYQDRVALGLLEMGFKKDDVMLIQLPMWAELFIARMACEKAGIIYCMLAQNLREKDIEYILKKTEAVGMVVPWKSGDRNFFEEVQSIRPNAPSLRHVFVVGDEVPEGAVSFNKMMQEPIEKKYPEDYLQQTKTPAWEVSHITTTTGTTGFPKISEYVCGARVSRWIETTKKFGMTKDDVILVMGPGGVIFSPASDGAPMVGAKIVMQERFDPGEALRIIEKEKVTMFAAVPTMLQRLLAHPDFDKYDYSTLKFIRCGGGFVPYELCEETEKKLGARVGQTYGSADRGGGTIPDAKAPSEVRWITAGKPDKWSKVSIVDDEGKELPQGEVGSVMFFMPTGAVGYFKEPEATKEAYASGWYQMGDLGKLDADGNLVLVGRKRDIIIRGGQNIYPGEIESLLQLHPKVFQAALVKMPDREYGEKACAYVVPKGDKPITFEEMVAFLKEQKITSYKIPERLEIIESMPLAGGMKIEKRTLEEDVEKKLKKEGRI